MKINYSRTGGFAGIPLKATVDTDQVEDKNFTDKLLDLVKKAFPFNKSEKNKDANDLYEYHFQVENGEEKYDLSLSDTQMSEALNTLSQALIDWVISQKVAAKAAKKAEKPSDDNK